MLAALTLVAVVAGQATCVTPMAPWHPSRPEMLRLDDGTAFASYEPSSCTGESDALARLSISRTEE